MSNIASRMSGYGRFSKKTIGKHPIECPKPAIGNGVELIKIRHCPKDVSRIWMYNMIKEQCS